LDPTQDLPGSKVTNVIQIDGCDLAALEHEADAVAMSAVNASTASA
jgi:hypothetical protein